MAENMDKREEVYFNHFKPQWEQMQRMFKKRKKKPAMNYEIRHGSGACWIVPRNNDVLH